MIDLVVNKNSYTTVADADDLLLTSPRSALAWSQLAAADKVGALLTAFRLLEQQTWQGTRGAFLNVATAVPAIAGTGYEVGDEVEIVGGVSVQVATFVVKTVDGIGAVLALTPVNAGLYSTFPGTSVTTTTSGIGSGLELAITSVAQQASWPRSGVTDRYGQPVYTDTVPIAIAQAQAIYAYELLINPALEIARDANGNVKAVRAGSVGVDFFGPTLAAGRFPWNVQELLREFLGSSVGSGTGGIFATGTGASSEFSEKRYDVDGI